VTRGSAQSSGEHARAAGPAHGVAGSGLARVRRRAVLIRRSGSARTSIETVLSEGSREAFGGDTEALVARWLYASGQA
jgi:hypothetical protein